METAEQNNNNNSKTEDSYEDDFEPESQSDEKPTEPTPSPFKVCSMHTIHSVSEPLIDYRYQSYRLARVWNFSDMSHMIICETYFFVECKT